MRRARPRVLVVARNYPNNVLPTLGIWTERLVLASADAAEPTVVAPVPYVPPGVPLRAFARYRDVARRRSTDGVDVFHPRVASAPGYLLHPVEAALTFPTIRATVDRLHQERGFDLIHAHFIYPDGVIAARLGRLYGLPVVSTEQAPWLPWLDDYPRVRRQVEEALPHIRVVTAVSESLRRNIRAAVGDAVETAVVPNVVDDAVFGVPPLDEPWDPNRILFVGVVRRVKGLDVLVQAFARLAAARPELTLVVVGAAYHRSYQRDEAEVRRLIASFGLSGRIRFTGQATPAEVAAAMRTSALLVVPSRRETFASVVVESLASGTPVVATRCGGPEETLTPEMGKLVAPEDPVALAAAIDDVLSARASYDRAKLRSYAVSHFGRAAAARRLEALYRRVLDRAPDDAADAAGAGVSA